MARLEQLAPGATVRGLIPNELATIVEAKWYGDNALEIVFRDQSGRVHSQILFRDREAVLEVVNPGFGWSLDADGELLRLVSEATRIQLAHLFDPMLAVHTSMMRQSATRR